MTRKLRVKDAGGERELLLVGTMRVGRDPRCEISSADPALSRQHAEFIESGGRTVVRDLDSRHGILVNGVKATEATLQPDDVVQVAGVTITYLVEQPTASRSGLETASDDQTVVIRRSPPAAPAASPPPPGPEPGASDATVIVRAMPPPVPEPDLDTFRREPDPVAPRQAVPASTPPAPAPPPKAPAQPRPSKAPPAVSAPAPPPTAVDAGDVPIGKAPAVPTPRKKYRLSWTAAVWVALFLMAAAVFLATAVPFLLYQQAVVDATATSRAQALGRWLAADAGAALAGARDISIAADDVGRQPGVVAAFVLAPDGDVLAPASRSTERFAAIPAIGAPAEIFAVRAVERGDVIEVVAPVQIRGEDRAAVVWLTFRPSAGTTVSLAVAIGPALVLTLVAWIVAARLVQRRTLRSVANFGEDIELATAGQIDEVGDTLGVKPMDDVARAVNYLLARVRTGAAAGGPAVRPAPGAARAAARVVRSSRQEPVVEAAPVDCTIVANEKFRITEATEGALELLGVAPAALKGQHLLDAVPDRAIGDAMLTLLTDVTEGGDRSVSVRPTGQTFGLVVHVSRSGPSSPVVVRFAREER